MTDIIHHLKELCWVVGLAAAAMLIGLIIDFEVSHGRRP